MPCLVYKTPCLDHGFIHGAEAEELREGLEAMISAGDGATTEDLQQLLESVDARDSVAYREATRRQKAGRRRG